jgi:hypothetical protein
MPTKNYSCVGIPYVGSILVDTPGSIKILHLCGIDPFLIHLHPPFKVIRPVRMGQLAITDLM